MSTRLFSHLAHECREQFAHFEETLHREGIDFVRTCVWRSAAEQTALYEQGRTKPGHIVTWAKAGQSKHNRTAGGLPASHAADYYPLWNGKLADRRHQEQIQLWQKLGAAATAAGLEWGGNWTPPKADFPHVQFKGT